MYPDSVAVKAGKKKSRFRIEKSREIQNNGEPICETMARRYQLEMRMKGRTNDLKKKRKKKGAG